MDTAGSRLRLIAILFAVSLAALVVAACGGGEGGGGGLATLTPASLPDPTIDTTTAAAAPSQSLPARPDASVLYVIDEDGSNLRELLTQDSISQVQWSPNGEEVAFVMGTSGVLQVAAIRADGGEPEVLRAIEDPTSSIDVLWSSAGIIAVLVEGEGEILERDGSVRGSFSASNLVAWSPDGNRLLTRTNDGTQTHLQVIDAATMNVRDVAIAPNRGSGVARWSPDGEEVSILAGVDDAGCEGGLASALDVVHVDSGERRRVLEPMCANFNSHAWSPDGSEIAVVSPTRSTEADGSVLVVDVATGSVRRLFGDTIDFSVEWLSDGRHLALRRASCWGCGGGHWAALVNADGDKIAEWPGNTGSIAAASTTPRVAVSTDLGELLIANADGSSQTLFGAAPFLFQSIAWSPDESQIAFVRWPGFKSSNYIAAFDDELVESVPLPARAYTSGLAPDLEHVAYALDSTLVVAETSRPSEGIHIDVTGRILNGQPMLWSPDGEQIALVRQRDEQPKELVVVALDSSTITVITQPGPFNLDFSYMWTPDSAQLLVASGDDQNPDPGLFDIATGVITAFAAPRGDWAPDGSEIVYSTSEEVLIAGVDGSSRSVLSFPPRVTGQPAWSPDGQTIAVMQINAIIGGGSLMLVDADGSNAREVAVATLHYGRFAGETIPSLRPYSTTTFSPQWSPDSSSVAVPFMNEEGHGVFVYDVGTGEMRPISVSRNGSFRHLPRGWSPNGERLAFELVWQGP